MKKGQGLSLNTVIIAAIVLIVLVVLWAIFTGRMGVFSQGVSETDSPEGCKKQCSAIGQSNGVIRTDNCDDGETNLRSMGEGKVCCCTSAAS